MTQISNELRTAIRVMRKTFARCHAEDPITEISWEVADVIEAFEKDYPKERSGRHSWNGQKLKSQKVR